MGPCHFRQKTKHRKKKSNGVGALREPCGSLAGYAKDIEVFGGGFNRLFKARGPSHYIFFV